jgi:hypothetical protein
MADLGNDPRHGKVAVLRSMPAPPALIADSQWLIAG